jgi:hypothetical protein
MNGRIRVLSLLTRLQDKDEEQMWQSAHLWQTLHRIRYGALIKTCARATQRHALDASGRTRRRPLAQMCAAPLRAAVRRCDV